MEDTNSSLEQKSGKQEYLSRHERRLQMRAQRRSDGDVSRGTRRWMLWGGVLLLLVAVTWGMVKLSANVPVAPSEGVLVDPVNDRDHSTGPASASLTLVEYSDFQCPACAAYYPVVKKLLAEPQVSGKIRFVYRSFPLTAIHPNADLAARTAEAAAEQGKFWEMHDALFEAQRSWAGLSSTGARAAFLGYAQTIGVNTETLRTAVDSGAIKDRVRDVAQSGVRSGVNSTPTFFLNGKQLPQSNSYEEFRQGILNALNENP